MENIITSLQEISNLSGDSPYYFYGDKSYSTGWKMHLFLNSASDRFPDLHNETIHKLSKFLIEHNLEHKFKNGNDGANTFCIYIGDREQCEVIAKELIDKFGREFNQLSKDGNSFKGSDQNLFGNHNIGIRFDGVNDKLSNSPFLRYGTNGIPQFLHNTYPAQAILGRNITNEQEEKLKKVASHIILAKYCGDKYLGKNYHKHAWDNELFMNISEFSSQEVEKYTKSCIAMFTPEKYIKSSSKVLPEESYNIDVSKKMQNLQPKAKLLNKVNIKNHSYSLKNADNIQLVKKEDQSHEELIWQQQDKKLAKCATMPEGHSFVSLYDDKDNESKFMVYKDGVYEVINGQAKLINDGFLSCYVNNISIESIALRKKMITPNNQSKSLSK